MVGLDAGAWSFGSGPGAILGEQRCRTGLSDLSTCVCSVSRSFGRFGSGSSRFSGRVGGQLRNLGERSGALDPDLVSCLIHRDDAGTGDGPGLVCRHGWWEWAGKIATFSFGSRDRCT